MKIIRLISTLALLTLLLSGCSGGGDTIIIPDTKLVVGSIKGPLAVGEGSTVEFEVEASGDTGITYLWAFDPSSIGELVNRVVAKARFTPFAVSSDQSAVLTVTVSSDNYGPVVKSVNILITEVETLTVGQINGPENLDEFATRTFSILAAGDTGISYQWECDPSTLGTFFDSQSAITGFKVSSINSDINGSISVTVSSNNYISQGRTIDVLVNDIEFLVVGDIQGPNLVYSNSFAQYSVEAYGDSGITYNWEVTPPDVGYFPQNNAPFVEFIANSPPQHTPAVITVTVESDIYPAIKRVLDFSVSADISGWVRTWGDQGEVFGQAVAVAPNGDILVLGEFYWTCDFDPGYGTSEITSSNSYDLYLSRFDPYGKYLWTRVFPCDYRGYAEEVVVDGSGNIYIVGTFQAMADFDPGPGETLLLTHGGQDVFLCKLNSNGGLIWVNTWGGSDDDNAPGLTFDNAGDIYVTGAFGYSVDFNPDPLEEDIHEAPYYGVYLSKFSVGGDFLWVKTWCDDLESYSYGTAFCADSDGSNIFVAGYFYDTVDLDPGPDIDLRETDSGEQGFISRFDKNGNYVYGLTWETHSVFPYAISVSENGQVYVAGEYEYNADLDPGPGVKLGGDYYYDGVFLERFNLDGNCLWERNWGTYTQGDFSLLVSKSGNVTVGSSFGYTMNMDFGGTYLEFDPVGNYDFYVARFDSNGKFFWVNTWGSFGYDYLYDMAFTQNDEMLLTGSFGADLDFDPGLNEFIVENTGGEDAFLLKLLQHGTWD